MRAQAPSIDPMMRNHDRAVSAVGRRGDSLHTKLAPPMRRRMARSLLFGGADRALTPPASTAGLLCRVYADRSAAAPRVPPDRIWRRRIAGSKSGLLPAVCALQSASRSCQKSGQAVTRTGSAGCCRTGGACQRPCSTVLISRSISPTTWRANGPRCRYNALVMTT